MSLISDIVSSGLNICIADASVEFPSAPEVPSRVSQPELRLASEEFVGRCTFEQDQCLRNAHRGRDIYNYVDVIRHYAQRSHVMPCLPATSRGISLHSFIYLSCLNILQRYLGAHSRWYVSCPFAGLKLTKLLAFTSYQLLWCGYRGRRSAAGAAPQLVFVDETRKGLAIHPQPNG